MTLVDLSRTQCVGYLRVSSGEQAGDTKTSPDDQMAAILTPPRDRGIV